MSDTLATINVDQLSNAVSAVVQATAIGQLPLDPSPPPLPREGVHNPQHNGAQTVTSVNAAEMGSGGRTVLSIPTEIKIPASVVPSAQLTIPITVAQQAPLIPTQNVTVTNSGPVIYRVNVPSTRTMPNQILTVPQLQTNTITVQPPSQQTAAGRQTYSLKQIGNKLVLVPTTQPQNALPQSVFNAGSLVQPVTARNESVIYQPTGSLLQGATLNNPAICAHSSNAPSVNAQQPQQINMNIAIHIPSTGSAPQIPGVNQLSGCGLQAAPQQIRRQLISQDNAQMVSQIVNVAPQMPANHCYQNNNQAQLVNVIVPNQAVTNQVQMRPLNSQMTPQVTSLTQPLTFITQPNGGNPDCIQLKTNINSNSPATSYWTNPTSGVTNMSLVSPNVNPGTQGQLLSPFTSMTSQRVVQSQSQENQIVSLQEAIQLQQTLLKANQVRTVCSSNSDDSGGTLYTESATAQADTTQKQRSECTTSDLQVKVSGDARQSQKKKAPSQDPELWCAVCKSFMRGCVHQKSGTVIQDKPIESRAKQSLPDIVTLKSSSVSTSELGVFAEQEIQPNTRFGPLVGKMSEVNPSDEVVAAHPKAWRLFKDGNLHQLLHADDESSSNWMMFIKLARRRGQHNLWAFQSGHQIFFSSFKPIQPGQELIVWYSKAYNQLRGARERAESRLKCRQCGVRFPHHSQLTHHVKHDHPTTSTAADAPPRSEQRFKCSVCSRAYPTATKLNAHLLVHIGVKPHRCEVCGKGFTDRSNMKAHMVIHSGVKRYPCQTCGRSFRQKVHLKSHQVIHTGERSLQCPMCPKTFARHGDLSFHIKQHKDGRTVHCTICSKSFWKESQLVRHMKIHTGEKEFQCHLCGKGFITSYHLNRHLKSCERDERFRRKPWPGSEGNHRAGRPEDEPGTSQGSASEVPSGRKDQRHRGKRKRQEESSSRVLRSSRGRPLRPKILPDDVARLDDMSRRKDGLKRKAKSSAAFGRASNAVRSAASSEAATVAITVYEVQSGQSQNRRHSTNQVPHTVSQVPISRTSSENRKTPPAGIPAAAGSYRLSAEESRGRNQGTGHQQPSSTLSQLAIAVPQESPGVLDCDAFTASTSIAQTPLESGFGYNSQESPGGDEIHDASLSNTLFDLGEGTSMSSSTQSISGYNPQSFALGDEDTHADAFSGPQVHGRTQSLFMGAPPMDPSVPGTSRSNLQGHQEPGSSLPGDSLFTIDPNEETGSSLPQHAGDEIDDIDLRAIEGALDSDEEEQCTDERRGDSPSEHIEE